MAKRKTRKRVRCPGSHQVPKWHGGCFARDLIAVCPECGEKFIRLFRSMQGIPNARLPVTPLHWVEAA